MQLATERRADGLWIDEHNRATAAEAEVERLKERLEEYGKISLGVTRRGMEVQAQAAKAEAEVERLRGVLGRIASRKQARAPDEVEAWELQDMARAALTPKETT